MGRLCSALIFGVVSLCSSVQAESAAPGRSPQSKPARTPPTIYGSLSVTQPTALPPVDSFYLQYLSKTDATVQRLYQDRWAYHEMQVRYAMASYEYEHLSIGSCDFFGSAPYEGDVRHQFASQVLRMRVDSAMRAYFAEPQRARTVQRAQRTLRALDSIKNSSMKFQSKSKTPTEIRLGYDVISDASKIEVSRGKTQVGVYHPRLINGFTGGGNALNDLSVRVTTELGQTLPSAYFSYRFAVAAFEGGVVKTLTPTVSTLFSASQTFQTGGDPNLNAYRVMLSYSF